MTTLNALIQRTRRANLTLLQGKLTWPDEVAGLGDYFRRINYNWSHQGAPADVPTSVEGLIL